MKKSQHGFSKVKVLVVLVIAGMIGIGLFVWHSQKNNDKASSQTANSSVGANSSQDANGKTGFSAGYFYLKEWNVRAKYGDALTIGYTLAGNTAQFTSVQLASSVPSSDIHNHQATNDGCRNYGGSIERLKTGEKLDSNPETQPVEQMLSGPGVSILYKKIGDYYYLFLPSKSLCPSITDPNSPAAALQAQTNAAVESIVKNLETTPVQ
jgi:cytoskeletal protein RodZ